MSNPTALQLGLRAATVGDGVTSEGAFNVTDYSSADQAIKAALNHSSVIYLLPGLYPFAESISLSGPAVILGDWGAVLSPAHSGSVGLFSSTGNNFKLSGVKILVDTAVNDQQMVVCSGRRPVIENCLVDVTTTDGSDSNPMLIFLLKNTPYGVIRHNVIHPNAGVDCINVNTHGVTAQGAPGIKVIHNTICDDAILGLGPAGARPDGRRCHGGIRYIGSGYGEISHNLLYALGTYHASDPGSVSKVTWGIRVQKAALPLGVEAGHIRIVENMIELCSLDKSMELWGLNTFTVRGNIIGFNNNTSTNGIAAAAGDGGIILTGYLGAAFGETAGSASFPFACFGGLIEGNDVHNVCGDSDTAAIVVDDASECTFRDNKISVINNNGSGIWFRQASALSLNRANRVEGNDFDSASSTGSAVKIDDVTGWIRNGITVRNNTRASFTGGYTVPQVVVGAYTFTFAVSGATTTCTVTSGGSGVLTDDGWASTDKVSIYGMSTANNNIEARTITITGNDTFTFATSGLTHASPTSAVSAANEGPTAGCIMTHLKTGQKTVADNIDMLTPSV